MAFILHFACGFGHKLGAYDAASQAINLEGHFCPVCMGGIVGAGDMIDPRILAPMQEPEQVIAMLLPIKGTPHEGGHL